MNFDQTVGLVHLNSHYTVAETVTRLQAILKARGIPLLAHIDHSGDAARAGVTMNPTQLLIFGNAKAGTPLMIASPTLAIDLPLKALIWQDAEGQVWLSYNDLEYLVARHHIPKELLGNIAAIATVCKEAASRRA
jgi:uncharacterized protein (DUF302 family)